MTASATAERTPAAPETSGAARGTMRGRTIVRGLPLLPAVVLLLIFLAGPIIYCIYYAFTDMQLTGATTTNFVGLANFRKAFGDDQFYNAILQTLIFTVLSAIVGQNLLGLAIALLFRLATKVLRSIVGALVIAAWVVPEIVAGYLMYAFFRDEGSLNEILKFLHLPQQNWLYTLPILAVSLANVWRGTAFSMLVYSAALAEVPAELTEAAAMDGAGVWQRFWHVTLPTIRRSVATNLMLITLQTLSVFGLIFAMTKGGPSNKSTTLPIYTYQTALQNYEIGYGTAMALVLLVIGALFSLVYLRALRPEAD
ncbi:amino acid ABC transporter permease [Actinocatenispora thailandica]|uniref:Amino acid ABC transporter permease n=1 Tax=Actinocatenispora thailandica TaxID=227318 RepID=A0A7R7HYV5_9ACTN|nr:sugar ABC transporter permease [Actinocatenispora thailandica]BCJ36936.1 amino acid ABC transporter permease [Actinocatenispora thailandica]